MSQPDKASSASPTPSAPRRISSALAILALLGYVTASLIFGRFGGPRLITLRNATEHTLSYTFVEHQNADRPHAEFKGVLEPGDVATLRARILDKLTLWSDDAGRYVVNFDDKCTTYRIEWQGDRIIVREFNPGETMP